MGTAFTGMMGGYYHGMMGYPSIGGISPLLTGIGISGVICGIIILVGAYMVNTRPSSHTLWGIVILAVSTASLFEGGGFLIGAILGALGGIFAITWKPPVAAGAKGPG